MRKIFLLSILLICLVGFALYQLRPEIIFGPRYESTAVIQIHPSRAVDT